MLLVSLVATDLANVFPKDFSLRRHRINFLPGNLHRHINIVRMHNLFVSRIRIHEFAH